VEALTLKAVYLVLDILLEAVKVENTVGQITICMLRSKAVMGGILLEAVLVFQHWVIHGVEMAVLVLEVGEGKDKAMTEIRAAVTAAMALY
jgi:hypothetical protein